MSETPKFPAGSVLGYPRIGPRRELKKALEAFWAGRTSAEEVEATAAGLRKRTRTRLAELGLATDVPAIPSAFSVYDHVLDATAVVGAVPARFADVHFAQMTELEKVTEYTGMRFSGWRPISPCQSC